MKTQPWLMSATLPLMGLAHTAHAKPPVTTPKPRTATPKKPVAKKPVPTVASKPVAPLAVREASPGTPRYQPGGAVTSLAYSGGGQTLAVGDGSSLVGVYDARTGKLIRTVKTEMSASDVALSPDGTQLLVTNIDLHARLYEVATGKLLHSFNLEVAAHLAVSFSPNGKLLAIACMGLVGVFDAATYQRTVPFSTKAASVPAVAWSRDGQRLATGGDDKQVQIWDATATGNVSKPLQILTGCQGPVESVSWSPDGTQVAAGARDATARIWNAATGAPLATFNVGDGPVHSVAFSPSGNSLAVTVARDPASNAGDADSGAQGEREVVQLWDLARRKPKLAVRGRSEVNHLSFAPDGKTLVTGDEAGGVLSYAVATLPWARPAATGGTGSQGNGGAPLVLTLGSLTPLPRSKAEVKTLAFSPDGTHLAAGNRDAQVVIWNMQSGKLERIVEGHRKAVDSLAWSPDGKMLASGGDDALQVVDAATGQTKWHQDRKGDLAGFPGSSGTLGGWTPTGTLIGLDEERTPTSWDAATGTFKTALQPKSRNNVKTRLSPDGKLLAIATNNFEYRRSLSDVVIVDVATHQRMQRFSGKGLISALAWAPDSKHLAFDSGDFADGLDERDHPVPDKYLVEVMDIDVSRGPLDNQPRKNVGFTLSFAQPVIALTWAPDGASIAIGWGTRNEFGLNVLNWKDRQIVATADNLQYAPQVIAFAPNGTTIALTGLGTPVELWRWK